MAGKYTALDDALHAYLVEHGSREDDVLRQVARETAALGDIAVMQIAPDQGALLTLLVRAIGARHALEVGTFTGYSAICIARGLDPDGKLLACEIDEKWAMVARANFERAGVADRIELRVAPAIETLGSLSDSEQFDFAFIDADKEEYPAYYELVLSYLRQGGVLMVDNVLRGGSVLDPDDDSRGNVGVRELNETLAADERVDVAMLGVADGIALARKR